MAKITAAARTMQVKGVSAALSLCCMNSGGNPNSAAQNAAVIGIRPVKYLVFTLYLSINLGIQPEGYVQTY